MVNGLISRIGLAYLEIGGILGFDPKLERRKG
jgi:hypothetical protein